MAISIKKRNKTEENWKILFEQIIKGNVIPVIGPEMIELDHIPSTQKIIRRTRQTLWSAVQMLTQKLCCQTIHDCPKVVPLHYESE